MSRRSKVLYGGRRLDSLDTKIDKSHRVSATNIKFCVKVAAI